MNYEIGTVTHEWQAQGNPGYVTNHSEKRDYLFFFFTVNTHISDKAAEGQTEARVPPVSMKGPV